MPGFISDSPLARGLVRIGDEAIAREDDAKLRDYFADDYVFHGPGGDLGFEELRAYFASLRAAFGNLRLVREQIIADSRFLARAPTYPWTVTTSALEVRLRGPALVGTVRGRRPVLAVATADAKGSGGPP